MVQGLWNQPSPIPASCTPFTLPAGQVPVATGFTFTIESPAVFTPACFNVSAAAGTSASQMGTSFVASTTPMLYAIASTVTLAYVLFLILIITPQKRPWLQKIATGCVAVVLTSIIVSMTGVMQKQFMDKYDDGQELRNSLLGGTLLKVARVLSSTFLWLALVQTLMRVFPRQQEKKVIKWTGFSLILLDVVFVILQNFLWQNNGEDEVLGAISALAYLFQITLSTIFAVCILYYTFRKRVTAYSLRNLPLGSLALISLLVPIAFFIVDLTLQEFAGWGNFVRWVSSAAASVLTWEWVERIERNERDMTKDGVLGRQIFENEIGDRTKKSASLSSGFPRIELLFRGPKVAWEPSKTNANTTASTFPPSSGQRDPSRERQSVPEPRPHHVYPVRRLNSHRPSSSLSMGLVDSPMESRSTDSTEPHSGSTDAHNLRDTPQATVSPAMPPQAERRIAFSQSRSSVAIVPSHAEPLTRHSSIGSSSSPPSFSRFQERDSWDGRNDV